MLIEKKEQNENLYNYRQLESGEVYECVEGDYYKGWVLLATSYSDLVGVWLSHSIGVLAEGTIGKESLRFRKMKVKLVEI